MSKGPKYLIIYARQTRIVPGSTVKTVNNPEPLSLPTYANKIPWKIKIHILKIPKKIKQLTKKTQLFH